MLDMYDQKLSFLSSILGKYKYYSSSSEVMFNCPFCSHHKPKLSINILTTQWQCWVCGNKGNKLIYPLRTAGATREQLKQYIKLFNQSVKLEKTNYKDIKFDVKLPISFSAIENCKDSFLGKKAFKYLKDRGIEDADILKYKIGFVTDGDFKNRIIFPSFNSTGGINFYTGRSYSGHYLNVEVPHSYRNSIILNELNINWNEPVVITEGFVDMLKSVPNTIPLYGSSLADDSLLWETIVLKADEIVMALDSDAWRKQDKICKKLTSYDVNVSVMKVDKKDLGECSKQEVLFSYESRVSWSSKESFLQRIRAL